MTLIPELRLELQSAAIRHARSGASRWRLLALPRPRTLIASGTAAACLTAVSVVVLVSATSSAAPAYALTRLRDGSITLRIYTLSRGIPQLNAKLRALGIDITVIPVRRGCPYSAPAYPVRAQQAITLRPTRPSSRPGQQGYIAVRPLSNGVMLYAQGALPSNKLPPCMSLTSLVIPSGITQYIGH